jgi:sec-independent protein translocase protein TatA
MPLLYASQITPALIIPTLGVQELIIILLIAVLIFGGRKIPEIFKGFGEGIREFKSAMKKEDKPAAPTEDKKEAPTPS